MLRVDYSQLPRLEHFVDEFQAAMEFERMKGKIVASEFFDNIVAHGRRVFPPFVLVSLIATPALSIEIRYRSSNFDEFHRALNKLFSSPGKVLKPRYDEVAGRYRGIGLGMSVRLASSISIRTGLFYHRVSIVF